MRVSGSPISQRRLRISETIITLIINGLVCHRTRQQAQHLSQYKEALLVAPGGGGDGDGQQHHFGVYAAFSGLHGTASCAPGACADAARLFPNELAHHMPPQPLHAGAERGSPCMRRYAARVRLAVAATFLAVSQRLDAAARPAAGGGGSCSTCCSTSSPKKGLEHPSRRFSAAAHHLFGGSHAAAAPAAPGHRSGGGAVAAVVAVQTGQLLTIAHVGGGRAVLDVGAAQVDLTVDHRVGRNQEEEARMARGERALG